MSRCLDSFEPNTWKLLIACCIILVSEDLLNEPLIRIGEVARQRCRSWGVSCQSDESLCELTNHQGFIIDLRPSTGSKRLPLLLPTYRAGMTPDPLAAHLLVIMDNGLVTFIFTRTCLWVCLPGVPWTLRQGLPIDDLKAEITY